MHAHPGVGRAVGEADDHVVAGQVDQGGILAELVRTRLELNVRDAQVLAPHFHDGLQGPVQGRCGGPGGDPQLGQVLGAAVAGLRQGGLGRLGIVVVAPVGVGIPAAHVGVEQLGRQDRVAFGEGGLVDRFHVDRQIQGFPNLGIAGRLNLIRDPERVEADGLDRPEVVGMGRPQRRRQAGHDEADLIVLHHRGRGVLVRHEHELDAVQVWPLVHPPVGVGLHRGHAQIRVVLGEHVGTADGGFVLGQPEGAQVLVRHVVDLDRIRVRGGNAPVEDRIGHLEGRLHGAVVKRDQAGDGVGLVGTRRGEALYVADVLRDAAVLREGIGHAVPGSDDLLGRNGSAVRPLGPGIHGEGPDRVAFTGHRAVEHAVAQVAVHVEEERGHVQQGHPALVVAAARHRIEGEAVRSGRAGGNAQNLFGGGIVRKHRRFLRRHRVARIGRRGGRGARRQHDHQNGQQAKNLQQPHGCRSCEYAVGYRLAGSA